MRKFTLLLLFGLFALIPSFAQKNNTGRDKRMEFKEYRMKVLAQEMDLKDDQQKKFFELYDQMMDEKFKLLKETKSLEKKLKSDAEVSDAEYKKVSDAITAAKEKLAAIEKKYDEKFSQFLSPKQIYKMKSAEEKFREKMNEMRHKKNNTKK